MDPPNSRTPRKPRRRVATLVAVAALAATSVAELLCRLVLGLGDPPLFVADPQIEYLMAPNQDVQRFGNRVLVNQWGMRSQPLPQKKSEANEFRVLVFGDSVINGGSQTDHRDLATTILQEKLQAKLGRPVRVGNVSAGSWGPGNWLEYVRRYGTFDADVVLLVVNSGDYADNPTYLPLNRQTHPTQKPVLALQEAIERYLPRYWPALRSTQGSTAGVAIEEPPAAQVEKGLRDLASFFEAARADGAKLAVLHHPDAAETTQGRFETGHELMRELCRRMGVAFIEMRTAYVSNGGAALYRDGIHPTSAGQAVLAGELLAALGNR